MRKILFYEFFLMKVFRLHGYGQDLFMVAFFTSPLDFFGYTDYSFKDFVFASWKSLPTTNGANIFSIGKECDLFVCYYRIILSYKGSTGF